MKPNRWLYAAALLLSLAGHVTFLRSMSAAARRAPVPRARVLEVAMIKRPPPPPPPPPPIQASRPVEPKAKIRPKGPEPLVKPLDKPIVPPPPPPNAPPPKPSTTPPRPVFGISMSSVVGPGAGSFAVRVGNTLMQEPGRAPPGPPGDAKPYNSVPAHRVTRMPSKLSECQATYPPDARQLGIEGRVTLDVEVRPDGLVGEVLVVSGLGHGLDEAAVMALKRCRFAPAQLEGENVGTRIQYIYTFQIED